MALKEQLTTMLPKPTDAEIVRSVFPDAYTYCQGEDSLYMVHSHKFGGWMTTGHYARSDAWKAARAKLASSVGQQPAEPVEQLGAGMEQGREQVLPPTRKGLVAPLGNKRLKELTTADWAEIEELNQIASELLWHRTKQERGQE